MGLLADTVEGSNKKGGKGGDKEGRDTYKTLLSCVSARWFDGRLCEEREERGEEWRLVYFFLFFLFPLRSFSSPYPSLVMG